MPRKHTPAENYTAPIPERVKSVVRSDIEIYAGLFWQELFIRDDKGFRIEIFSSDYRHGVELKIAARMKELE